MPRQGDATLIQRQRAVEIDLATFECRDDAIQFGLRILERECLNIRQPARSSLASSLGAVSRCVMCAISLGLFVALIHAVGPFQSWKKSQREMRRAHASSR